VNGTFNVWKSLNKRKTMFRFINWAMILATGDVYRFGLGARGPLEKLNFSHSQNSSQFPHKNDEVVQIVAGGYHFLALTGELISMSSLCSAIRNSEL
jgi:hypothetical protein